MNRPDNCPIKVPRQYIKQTQRDRHDFNDMYINAIAARIRWFKHKEPLPRKKIYSRPFWVDVEYRRFP